MVLVLVERASIYLSSLSGTAVPKWFSVVTWSPAQAREISPTAAVARPIRLACG
jgi:hypothetical protein